MEIEKVLMLMEEEIRVVKELDVGDSEKRRLAVMYHVARMEHMISVIEMFVEFEELENED